MNNDYYLTNIPQDMEKHGLCKTLLVRNESIHLKHILTEIFIRYTVDLEALLRLLEWDYKNYMEYFTNRMRRIYKISRDYKGDFNEIVKSDRKKFFPVIELLKGNKNVIVLDFDGVTNEKSFRELYNLCIVRCKTVICSANPLITEEWFTKRGYKLPDKIYSCKGMKGKLRRLVELQKHHDFMFYVDNEEKYLDLAWMLGIKTYKYEHGKIVNFSCNSK